MFFWGGGVFLAAEKAKLNRKWGLPPLITTLLTYIVPTGRYHSNTALYVAILTLHLRDRQSRESPSAMSDSYRSHSITSNTYSRTDSYLANPFPHSPVILSTAYNTQHARLVHLPFIVPIAISKIVEGEPLSSPLSPSLSSLSSRSASGSANPISLGSGIVAVDKTNALGQQLLSQAEGSALSSA